MIALRGVVTALALFVATFGVEGAANADPDRCDVTKLPVPNETEFPLLYAPRHDELTVEARYLGSWMPVLSALDFGVRYAFAPFDQRLHLGLKAGGTAGEWGSDRRGSFAFTGGLRVAYDFYRPMSGVIDTYMLVETDVLLFAERGDPVLRPGAGFGFRIGRMIGVEATFNPLVSLGKSFAKGEKFDGGFGIGVSYDLCTIGGACDETSRTPVENDLTPRLYELARHTKVDAAQQTMLCSAVERALDAGRYRPHDKIDSTEAFLRGVADNLTDPALRAEVQAITAKHVQLRTDWEESHRAERSALADGQHLADHCVYEPFPLELRTILGCAAPP